MLLVSALRFPAMAQNSQLRYPPQFPDAKAEVYKTSGPTSLSLYIFEPPGKGASRPAIVFFFGGGWRNGSPAQFEGQCRRLASLGMVAISADYRVSSRNHSTVLDSIRDAKSAIRYVRRNAARLGIDPRRIAAGGGSAGGHIAAVAGVIPGLDEPGEDASISSKPDALVLFNPALSLTGDGTAETLSSRPEFAGVDLASISPVRFVSKGAPPAIIFHGKADQLVPYATVEAFTKKSQAAGNRCELVGYEGQGHGFFNQRPGNRYYGETLQSAEKFLASLGYLKAPAAGS
jgi:acetyl esterase/lipase